MLREWGGVCLQVGVGGARHGSARLAQSRAPPGLVAICLQQLCASCGTAWLPSCASPPPLPAPQGTLRSRYQATLAGFAVFTGATMLLMLTGM